LHDLLGPPGHQVAWPAWLPCWAAAVGDVAEAAGVALDPVALLAERAELLGHRGWGPISAGGSARMVRACDAWMVVNLPRDGDVADVAAWLDGQAGPDPGAAGVWEAIAGVLASAPAAHWWERAGWLGLAVAPVACAGDRPPVLVTPGGQSPRSAGSSVRVLDLSSLWAGPLCGSILAAAGATVSKVDTVSRPDGARRTPVFYQRLNAAKTEVILDLRRDADRAELADLAARADVVIEASRPRGLARLGLDAAAAAQRGAVWVSITGYGRAGPHGDKVAFGDDAAAAGGLVTWHGQHEAPWFVGDALADPVTGVRAAGAVMAQLATGMGAVLDVSMADTAAELASAAGLPTGSRVGTRGFP
jgi:crotonobetainyl-CoA:carnitine CoA-transferase CaiB-like acyl-CoA transferase